MSKGVVYFITDGEAYKIGWTTRLSKRLQDLQNANHFPLVVIGTIKGGRFQEAALHRRFAKYRLMGEWFHICDEIADFIQHCKDSGVWIEFPEGHGVRGSVQYMKTFVAQKKNTIFSGH